VSNLPDGWSEAVLSDIAFIQMGQSPDSSTYNEKGIGLPFFQGKAEFGKLFPTIRKWCNEPKKVAEAGDILLSVRAPVGPTNLAQERCCIGRGLSAIQAITPFNQKYLLHYFRHIQPWMSEQGTGTTFAAVSGDFIRNLDIPIAPLNEQKQIADKLDRLLARVDACRDRLDRVSLILKRFRQSVLTAATSGELTENWRTEHKISEHEIEAGFDFVDAVCFGDFRFPSSWGVNRLGEIAEIVGGITKDTKKQDPSDEELPYLRVANVQRGFFDLSEIKTIRVPSQRIDKLLLKKGDILLNEGGDIDKLGRGWVWDGEIERCTFQNHVFRVRLHNENFEPKFFSWYGNLRGADYFISVGKQTTNLASINKSLLSALPVVIPPVEEQKEIVRRVEMLFDWADRIESHSQNAYEQVEQSIPALLNKAFQGELVPQDPTDEPASVLLERIQAEKSRIESEQKATHTVRRSNKENAKIPMKKTSDYLDALRLAFSELNGRSDASQLFDRAGFKPEETVQFYEALREIPEVRAAFENSEQVRSPQPQNPIETVVEQQSGEKGSFRLIELWLEDFKNLTDYTVRFDPAHSIDVVLGWNGTGKSNLFEALVIIFRDLHRWWEKNQWTQKPMKGYRLRYAIDAQIVDVVWQPSEMKRPKLKAGKLLAGNKQPEELANIKREQLLLPRFVFGYYSGPTNRLAEHFLPMKQDHYDRLLKATSDDPDTLNLLLEQRRFFCAENHHAKYVLLAFCHKQDEKINQFLEERLRIIGFESALFIIRKPRWAKKGHTAENFWGATGIMRRVMERLRRFAIAPMVIEQTVPDGFRSRKEEHYYFFLPDLQSLHAFAAEYQDARTFFLALESIDFSELIYDVKIQVRVKATETEEVGIAFHELSEGEQQLLMVLGLMRFTKSNQSLVLLDEPDTHLNPHWSVDYLKLLARVMSEDSSESEAQQTSQILMSTHDPLVIASLFKEQIHLLKRDWQTGICQWGQPSIDPRGLGFTGILTSEMFGMRSDLDEETLADLDTKVRIVAQEGSLTPAEEKELEKINQRLEAAGFQKAFSDPYYAAFIRAWSRRHSDLMAGVKFVNPEKQAEIDRIAREVLEESISELQAEAMN
jgi:restriction endonuclease S subunit/predicted ATPase